VSRAELIVLAASGPLGELCEGRDDDTVVLGADRPGPRLLAVTEALVPRA
jgi:hypothetical protein